MTNKYNLAGRAALALLGILSFAQITDAQTFPIPNKGDMLAGFRKTGVNQGTYEAVANIGNITNLEAVAAGATIPISNYSSAQLGNAFTDFNNLQWSVFGSFSGISFYAGFPPNTLWLTLARSDVNTQTTAPDRGMITGGQGPVRAQIISIGNGANFISGSSSSNANNTPFFIREPTGDSSSLSIFIEGGTDPTLGTFNDALPASLNVENTTPASFSAIARSDLYQSVQVGSTDPITHTTAGPMYYVGYFTLNTDGTMTFTRASASAVPQPPFLKITRVGTTSTISFLTTNGATYTLYYTNTAGMTTSVSNWPASPTTVTGNNGTNSILDTSSDPNRVYRVGAH